MTSNDRHASHDSPYRTGGHVPLGTSRHSPLTTVTTAATDSRLDLSNSDGFISNENRPHSPVLPYSPGMRSSMQRSSSKVDTSYSGNGMSNGDVPMQKFQSGLPPPPPVSHSWKRIDRWMEDNYEELFENICEGCTQNDINELEHELDCTLPQDVRESIQIHDGQERGGRPTGVVFGCMLLDCEEIVQEWKQWRRTNDEYLREDDSTTTRSPQLPSKAFAASSSSAAGASAPSPTSSTGSNWRYDLHTKQDSQPPNAIQKAYIHAGWIPLARDWGGNNICVDLAPGPAGQWGQIILMGRDYDCKYVVARSWSAFLANVADDMATDKWYLDEETKELKLREFPKQQNVAPAYMDILRWRADQKYGRRPRPSLSKRPSQQSSPVNKSQVKNDFASLNGFSPYASPLSTSPNRLTGPERGRSPPARHGSQPSPLSRVAEEANSKSKSSKSPSVDTTTDSSFSPQPLRKDRLISVDSPTDGSSDNNSLKPPKLLSPREARAANKENNRPNSGQAKEMDESLDKKNAEEVLS